MGIVIFSGLSEGSSYVFTAANLAQTYVDKKGTNINVNLFQTFADRKGVKSYLDLEEINNMVFTNPFVTSELLDPVAYTSKFTLLTHKNELIETHIADVKSNISQTFFRPDNWKEWKPPHRKFSKKVGNTVPDLVNAHHTNTPEGKTVILAKYDDSVHVLDHFGETLYRYKIESGLSLYVIALAANDEFLFFLKWKGTLSESEIDDDPNGTGYFNDYYEIEQRYLHSGEKVVIEWISDGVKLGNSLRTTFAVPINCNLEKRESFLNLGIDLDLSVSNNFINLQSDLDCLNCVFSSPDLQEIGNAISINPDLQEIENALILGIVLGGTQESEGINLGITLKCYQFYTGYFEIDHNTDIYFYESIKLTQGLTTKTRAVKSKNWAKDLHQDYSKVRPTLKTDITDISDPESIEKDATSVYTIRMGATKDGLFIVGSDPYLNTTSYVNGHFVPDSLPEFDSSDPDALRLRSFVCKYDFLKKWPTKVSSQLNRVCWLGFFVNESTMGMIFPARSMLVPYSSQSNYTKMIWYSYNKNLIVFENEYTSSITGQDAETEKTQWHKNIGQRDGFAKQCYSSGLVLGYMPHYSDNYAVYPIEEPYYFISDKKRSLRTLKSYSKFTPSILSFHLVSFPKYLQTSINLVTEEVKGINLGLNFVSSGIFNLTNGVKISSDFFQDHFLRLGSFELESEVGVKTTISLANRGYREKTIIVSNSSTLAAPFLPSREFYNFMESLSEEEFNLHNKLSLYNEYNYGAKSPYRTWAGGQLQSRSYRTSRFNGQYPQSLNYWTKNSYIPSGVIFDFYPPIEENLDHNSLSIEFFAKNIENIQDSVLLDYGLYSDIKGENLAIGYVKDNEWFIRTSNGDEEVFLSLGSLPTSSWDFYWIFIYQEPSDAFTSIFQLKIYKNGSLLHQIENQYIRFGQNKVYIGKNSKNDSELKGYIDQFKLKRQNGSNLWNDPVPSSIVDPTNPSFDFSNNGIFCLNGENGIIDETNTFNLVNTQVKISTTEFYYGSTSLKFDNSFLQVQIKVQQGIGWNISPDILGYKRFVHFHNPKPGNSTPIIDGRRYKNSGEYEAYSLPPVPVHFEVDPMESLLFGIYNKFDDDFSDVFYYEMIGGYFPFSLNDDILIDNENLLARPVLDPSDPNSPITENYWNEFYDPEEKKLAITREFTSRANYLPTARLFRSSNPNMEYDLEVNLPIRIVEETTANTYWFNYRKLGIDKTNKRLIIIRVKGGLDYRGFNSNYDSDLSEEGRNTSSYNLQFTEEAYPLWVWSWDLKYYTTVKAEYLLSSHFYEINTYINRDLLIYNYELGFVDHISTINGLQDDDVICHLYEKNGIFYILTQVKEPEPATPEDFFNTVLQNQTGYQDDIHSYKYTRYVYKQTRIYTLEGNLKTDTAVLFYEFNYSSSSLDSIMIQEVTDKHIWLNWDGVSRFEPIPFVGIALNLDGSGYTEVPFLQTVYFNTESQKWEIILRKINEHNSVPTLDEHLPLKIADRFPKVGNPKIERIGDRNFRKTTSSVVPWEFRIITDIIDVYNEENFQFIREEKIFQEVMESDERSGSLYGNSITNWFEISEGKALYAFYPAVSRVFYQKLYDWVKTDVFLVKTMTPVSQPNTWITYTNGGLFSFPFSVTNTKAVKSEPNIDDLRTIKTDVILG